jgi:hypothetical protein
MIHFIGAIPTATRNSGPRCQSGRSCRIFHQTRTYPHLPAPSFKFSAPFGSVLELFSTSHRTKNLQLRAHLTPGPRRPLFNGPLTTHPETVFGANHQPIQLSKNATLSGTRPRTVAHCIGLSRNIRAIYCFSNGSAISRRITGNRTLQNPYPAC